MQPVEKYEWGYVIITVVLALAGIAVAIVGTVNARHNASIKRFCFLDVNGTTSVEVTLNLPDRRTTWFLRTSESFIQALEIEPVNAGAEDPMILCEHDCGPLPSEGTIVEDGMSGEGTRIRLAEIDTHPLDYRLRVRRDHATTVLLQRFQSMC